MSQGVHIDFLKTLHDEDVYISTYDFKSYATYFYAKAKPAQNPKASDIRWLIDGNIDKPVYLVSKNPSTELKLNPSFKMVLAKGGFYIYKREHTLKENY